MTALAEGQQKVCPRTKKDAKISEKTRKLMRESRNRRSDRTATDRELKKLNKQVSKEIRKDIRNHEKREVEQTIENNRSMKVLRRKLTNGKKEIHKIKNREGKLTTNRKEILDIVEEFYQLLCRQKSTRR